MRTYKGIYKPKNPQKYKGDPTNIVYRSSWELKLMFYLDSHKDVINWGSEEIIIPYRSPVDDKIHRYFVDFIVTKINKDGKRETSLIEVKPLKETKPPKQSKTVTKRYLTEVKTWGVNSAKWKAAENFCKDRGWNFLIFTENDLFGPNYKGK